MSAGAACVHDWQPIMGWYARYRCGRCRVIGYKPGAVHPQHARCMAITAYRCEVRCGGKRCAEPAVHCWRGKKLRCAVHVHGGRTAKARTVLGGGGPARIDRESNAIDSGSTATDAESMTSDPGSTATDPESMTTDSESMTTDPESMTTDPGSSAVDVRSV